jgi:hypothetical protein
MQKIFNLSLDRSAAPHFIEFCEANGVKGQCWPGPAFDEAVKPALRGMNLDFVWQTYQPYLQQADAFADIPVPLFYRHAYETFPDAKFVLLLRAPQSWIKSVRHHCRDSRALDVLERMQYYFAFGRAILKLDEMTDLELFDGYEHFTEIVTCYYVSMKANFIVLDLAEPDVGPKLARFLDFEKVKAFPKIEHAL